MKHDGGKPVVDNVGLRVDNVGEIPYNEYRQLQKYIITKNHRKRKLPQLDHKEIGNNFYIWENHSRTNIEIIDSIPIEGNEDLIDFIRGELDGHNRRR